MMCDAVQVQDGHVNVCILYIVAIECSYILYKKYGQIYNKYKNNALIKGMEMKHMIHAQ